MTTLTATDVEAMLKRVRQTIPPPMTVWIGPVDKRKLDAASEWGSSPHMTGHGASINVVDELEPGEIYKTEPGMIEDTLRELRACPGAQARLLRAMANPKAREVT